MEIYRVVIVEDEPYAARHIKALIEKEENLRVSAVYENGEDALNGFASGRLQADLLVTDIQMPGISGLNLIREIQQIRPGIPSIIISGYSSFTYAKEAISLGTLQYILKPIDVEEFRAALQKTYEEIRKKRRENREQLSFKIQKNSEEVFSSEGAFDTGRKYRAMVFALSLSMEEMISRCMDYIPEDGYRVLNYRYSMVLLQAEEAAEIQTLEDVAERIRQKVCQKDKHGVFVTGKNFVSGEAVRKEIERLHKVLQECYYLGETHIVTEGSVQKRQQNYTNAHHLLTTQLLQQAGSHKMDDLKAVYDRVFDFFKKNRASVSEMRYTFFMLVSRIYQLDANRFDPTIESNKIMRRMYTSENYEEAGEEIWKIIRQLAEKDPAENEHSDGGMDVFWKVVHFLNTNISENYSLQEISDSFHISQPYLSKLFRKYKGVSYKEYCTNLKIQTSVKLMEENPNMLIKDIAERVGYDQLYFSSVFYRVMGEYPKQYRSRFVFYKSDACK